MWDFLLGFKAATEASFLRLEAKIDSLAERITVLETNVEARLDRLEADVAIIKSWNIPRRFDDLEERIDRLQERFDRLEGHFN
jgi:hypothetical protein